MINFRHFLRWRFGLAAPETQTTTDERDAISRYAAGKRCLVEIGVWHGVTTCRMRASMAPEGVIYAVDPYPIGRLRLSFQLRIAHKEVSKIQNGRVEWIRKTGEIAARDLTPKLDGTVDFVFIDGDHSWEGLKGDWEGWAPLIAPGGLIALHDSIATEFRPIHSAGSVRYTQEIISRDTRFQVIEEVDSLTILQRLPL